MLHELTFGTLQTQLVTNSFMVTSPVANLNFESMMQLVTSH